MIYRDIKTLFDKSIYDLDIILSDFADIQGFLEREINELSKFEKNHITKLFNLIKKEDKAKSDFFYYAKIIQKTLDIPFEKGMKTTQTLIAELEHAKSEYDKVSIHTEDSYSLMNELEALKKESMISYNEDYYNLKKYHHFFKEISDIKKYIYVNQLEVEKAFKYSFIHSFFKTKRAKLHEDISRFILSIYTSTFDEIKGIDAFNDFDKLYQLISDQKDLYSKKCDDYENLLNLIDEQNNNIFKKEALRDSAKNKLDDIYLSFGYNLFEKLFFILNESQQKDMFKSFSLPSIDEAKKDNDIRLSYLKKLKYKIEEDIDYLYDVIDNLNSSIPNINKAARKAPHKSCSDFNHREFKDYINKIKRINTKKSSWFNEKRTEYSKNTIVFNSYDDLVLLFIVNSNSTNAEIGHSIFTEDFKHIENINIDNLNVSFDIKNEAFEIANDMNIDNISVPDFSFNSPSYNDTPTYDSSSSVSSGFD